MNEVKIWFECWWACNNFEDQFILRYFKVFSPNINFIIDEKEPDLVIFSVFTLTEQNLYNKLELFNKAKKILYIGEPYFMYPFFYDKEKINKMFDLIISFDKDEIENKKIRLPLWILYNRFEKIYKSEDKDYISKFQNNHSDRHKFATMICRTDYSKNRVKMANLLNMIGKVDCPSYLNNNCSPIQEPDNEEGQIIAKFNFLKQYKINICPENIIQDGYTTEKLFQCLEAGCIPLYWGNADPEPFIINKDKIIFYNQNNEDEIIKKIVEINSEGGYEKYVLESFFLPTANDTIHNYIKTFEIAFLHLLTT